LDYVTSSGATSNRFDRVYWESKIISGVSVIAFRPIDLYDNNNNPLNWSVYSISRITRLYYDLLQPNITQGYQLPNTGIYGTGLLLDMKYYTGGMSNLIQLPHDINTLISYNSPTYYFAYNTQEIAEIGNLPHLSKQKCPLNSNQSWLIRRVYNLFNPNPPDIMTSARYSYRQNDEQNINDGLVGFRSINSNYLFYLPKLNNQVVGLKLPFEQFTDSLGITQLIRTNNDTIPSDWFTVEDMSNFEFKCKGNDSSKVRIAIQKESNGHIYNLKLPHHTPDSSGKLCKYILLNGNNCRYRLLFINRNDDAGYSEELWLGGLPVDTMQFTTNKAGVEMNYDVVDLGEGTNQDVINRNMTLSIRPNPADEVVYVRGLLPASAYLEFGNTISNHKIKYQVYSQIGCVQISVEGIPGETVSINTTNLPAGVYFISAEHKSDNYYEPVSPVVEPFVISR